MNGLRNREGTRRARPEILSQKGTEFCGKLEGMKAKVGAGAHAAFDDSITNADGKSIRKELRKLARA